MFIPTNYITWIQKCVDTATETWYIIFNGYKYVSNISVNPLTENGKAKGEIL